MEPHGKRSGGRGHIPGCGTFLLILYPRQAREIKPGRDPALRGLRAPKVPARLRVRSFPAGGSAARWRADPVGGCGAAAGAGGYREES